MYSERIGIHNIKADSINSPNNPNVFDFYFFFLLRGGGGGVVGVVFWGVGGFLVDLFVGFFSHFWLGLVLVEGFLFGLVWVGFWLGLGWFGFGLVVGFLFCFQFFSLFIQCTRALLIICCCSLYTFQKEEKHRDS